MVAGRQGLRSGQCDGALLGTQVGSAFRAMSPESPYRLRCVRLVISAADVHPSPADYPGWSAGWSGGVIRQVHVLGSHRLRAVCRAGGGHRVGHRRTLPPASPPGVSALPQQVAKAYPRQDLHIVCDLAIAVALGGDAACDIAVLRAQPGVFGPVASDPTVSRLIGWLAQDAQRALAAITRMGSRRRPGPGRSGGHRPGRDPG